jgi:DsbC/DsbD-like thiol-disulfide interchange protein
VCRKECIPEEGDFTLKLPVRSSTACNGAAFDAAQAAQPQPVLAGGGSVRAAPSIEGNSRCWRRVQGLPVEVRGKTLEFFPETGEVIETAARNWTQGWKAHLDRDVPLSPTSAAPARR